jgi:biotin carboxyl carrier protein
MVIDSMKIENNILAPRKGRIIKVIRREGDQVELNKPVMEIE